MIAAESGADPAEFLDLVDEGGRSIRVLKEKNGGCFFLGVGRCEVYKSRPFDCRLFPFDIRVDERGDLVWIVYTKLCPVEFSVEENFAAVRSLLSEAQLSEEELLDYALYQGRGMAGHEVLNLGLVLR